MLPQLQLVEKIVARGKLQLPQLQFHMVVHISVVAQRQFPMVLRTMAIHQLHVDRVFDVPVLQVVSVPQVPSWRRQSRSHSCTCLETRCLELFIAVRS